MASNANCSGCKIVRRLSVRMEHIFDRQNKINQGGYVRIFWKKA